MQGDGVAMQPTPVIRSLRNEDFDQLRVLNSVLFPVSYRASYYKALAACPELARGAFIGEELVAAACTILQKTPQQEVQLYIMSLGVLSDYREQGTGSELLKQVLVLAGQLGYVRSAALHVQTSNTGAIRFYEKRGFEKREVVKDYYKRLGCNDAVVMSKSLVGYGASAQEVDLP